MVNWIAEHRGTILVALAVSAVVVPLAIGVALGQIPRQLFMGSALPLAAAALILTAVVQVIVTRLGPVAKLVTSSVFGLIWIGAGLWMIRIERKSGGGPPQAARARRWISYSFLVFGLLWIALSFRGHHTQF